MVGCGQTSASWLPSTKPLPPSTRLSDAMGRRSSAFALRTRRGRGPNRRRTAEQRDERAPLLNDEINAIAADPIIKARLAGLGVNPMSMTSAAFGRFIVD